MTVRYGVVGALDRGVADAMGDIGGNAILVDDDNDEILVTQPTMEGENDA
ncbi:hypothetical protein GWG54_15145 [Natronococcus sp. JC468]|nr:hypothetical protein [Natronococcus sp. JC468]NKE37133.1 hypothetical protein [Natronococcus sp. JC468]